MQFHDANAMEAPNLTLFTKFISKPPTEIYTEATRVFSPP